jgi:hypothetical protein
VAFADTDLAQHYYNDFMSCEDCPVLRVNDYFLIVGDTSTPQFKKSHLGKMRKNDLLLLAQEFFGNDYYDCTKKELIEDLMMLTIGEYYQAKTFGWGSVEDYDFIITGYSQGDAIKVLLLDDAPKYITEDYLTHLFFDCPAHIGLEVVNNVTEVESEIYLEELLSNIYDYDKSEILDKLALDNTLEYKAEVLEFLESNLPDYLEVI